MKETTVETANMLHGEDQLDRAAMLAAVCVQGIGTGFATGAHLADGTPLFTLQLSGPPFILAGTPLQEARAVANFLVRPEDMGRIIGDLLTLAEHYGFGAEVDKLVQETVDGGREWYRVHCRKGPHTAEEVRNATQHPHAPTVDEPTAEHATVPGVDEDQDQPEGPAPTDPAGPTEGEGPAVEQLGSGILPAGGTIAFGPITTPGTATTPPPVLYPANGRPEPDPLGYGMGYGGASDR